MHASLPVSVALSTRERGFLRVLAEARRNALAIIPALCLKQPIVSGKVVRRFHMVQDPESLRVILRDRVDQYPKSPEVGAILRPAIGRGLFTSDGDHWRWQRRAAAPVFSRRNVETLGPVMTRAARAVSGRLDAALDGTATAEIDMADQMLLTAFDVIGQVCFSHNDGIPHDLARRAIERYLAGAGRVSLFDFLGLPEWVPRPARLMVGGDLKRLKSAAVTAIEARRTMEVDSPDLLDMLMASEDPDTGRRMTTEELRDNVLTFLVAGHETTALALSWSLYLLAFDPAVQTRARDQARQVLGSRAATVEDVPALPFFRQIIDEAMRLYPPAALLTRTALAPDQLRDREIRTGDTVMLPIYALHRNRELWDNPDSFNPDRFEDPRAIPPFQYLPFGTGPRVCIGMSFAMQEAVIILSTLLARYRFEAIPDRDPRPEMVLSLRPVGGVWLRVSRA
ncbi:cytochrome P450 [Aliiroseovarius sp.]|uniref:cytochrome P450 n=1 Tax=Aliiroseovarius sp. TaxID=1872442 RepID=UPI0026250A43|nr:cytochrome P450 [Aliiroseovarius sp.]